MPLTNKDRMGNIAPQTGVIIPPFPKPKLSSEFIRAFPAQAKAMLEHHTEIEEWRQKTNQELITKLGT